MDEHEVAIWEDRLQRAAAAGAQAALARIGLGDESAAKDVDEFRSVMSMWRDLRQEAYRTFVRWGVMAVLALVIYSVSPKLSYLLGVK